MPTVINGIGTWNYGKDKIHRIKGACENCNAVGELMSYDTTLYFVVFFIPVIPLKKNRVLSQCPACQKFRCVSVKEWNRVKQEAVTAALAEVAAKPRDNEALAAALATATQFQDGALFDRIAALAKAETEDAKLQHFLGVSFGYFSRREEADEAFRHALRTDPSPAVYSAAAMNALRAGDLTQAVAYLEFVTRDRQIEYVPYLLAVQDALQSQGRHEEALALMDLRDGAFPDLAGDKDLAKARKQSERYRGSGKKLKTMNLIDGARSGTSDGGRFSGRFVKLLFPLLLVAGFAGFAAYSVWLQSNRPVYIVNGTAAPYKATVNGEPLLLPAQAPLKVTVPEGDVVVEADGFAPVAAAVTGDFWSRPFADKVTVVNPDRVAVFVEETATYSANPGPDSGLPIISMGSNSYSFAKPHHLFEEFPAQIKVKGGKTTTRTRLGLAAGLTPIEYVGLALRPGRSEGPAATLKALCVAFPEQAIFLMPAVAMMPPAEKTAFLKPMLARRPLLIDWHRLYQSTVETADPGHDLVAEYTRLDAEVRSADSKYLLARAVPDRAASLALMKEAAAGPGASPYAHYALAYAAMGAADFAVAEGHAVVAYKTQPANDTFLQVYLDALWANRKYAEYAGAVAVAAGQGGRYVRFGQGLSRVRAAAVQKDDAELRRAIEAATAAHRGGAPAQDAIAAAVAVVRGDAAGALAAWDKIPSDQLAPGNAIAAALLRGDVAKAAPLVEALDATKPYPAGAALVALAYHRAGDATNAERFTKLYAESIRTQGREGAAYADVLVGRKPFNLKAVIDDTLFPEDKRLVLRLLAAVHPAHAAALTDLARKLDYHRDEVSLVLTKWSAE